MITVVIIVSFIFGFFIAHTFDKENKEGKL